MHYTHTSYAKIAIDFQQKGERMGRSPIVTFCRQLKNLKIEGF